MAVNLSPVGGVAAQFFTNTGAVLTGGKIYTYAAGTTTPAVTYTSSQGLTAWSNPIDLDAAGRVSGIGEIWLTDGITYKFVLKDSNDVLIATYDNISGINSNFVAYTNSQEIQTATASQTVFTLTTMQYQVGTNSLSVFVDGVNQYGPGAQYAYTETSSTSVTFVSGLHVGAEVKFTSTQQQGAGAIAASQVSYTPAGASAVTTNVQAKLRQYVNVKDFGATGNGVTDDSAAIQAAINAAFQFANSFPGLSKGTIYFPEGVYLISSNINATSIGAMIGDSRHSCLIVYSGATTINCNVGIQINNLAFSGSNTQTALTFTLAYLAQINFNSFIGFGKAIDVLNPSNSTTFNQIQNNIFQSCTVSIAFAGTVTTTYIVGNQFNTGTTAISCGGNFGTQITNNVFEDLQTAVLIPNGGVCNYGVIAGNWFERTGASAFPNIVPYQDNTASPGFFAFNTFSGNRYVNTGTYTYGVTSIVQEDGNIVLTPGALSGYSDGRVYSRSGIRPSSASAAAFLTPEGFTVETQSAISTGPSNGGDFVFKAGAGSIGFIHGAFRPDTTNVSDIGSPTKIWRFVYSNYARTEPNTVATLLSAFGTGVGAGVRAFVSDATATTFGTIVVGGGSNNVPVYSDGTNWRIG
jgi:hypothetical protein